MLKELLFSVTKKDLIIDYFNGKGNGGQNRQKNKNCVRIHHPESGVIVTGQEERSQKQNLKNAFLRLTKHPKFNKWLKLKSSGMLLDVEKEKKEIAKIVDNYMKPENLKIEYF